MKMNPDYIDKQVKEFNRPKASFKDRDYVLYRIGSHCNMFDDADYRQIQSLDNRLTPKLRCRVLDWLLVNTAHEIEGHLTQHIFAEEQLHTWYLELERCIFGDYVGYHC